MNNVLALLAFFGIVFYKANIQKFILDLSNQDLCVLSNFQGHFEATWAFTVTVKQILDILHNFIRSKIS